MVDINGEELEVGTIYLIPATSSLMTFGKYRNETEKTYVFDKVKHNNDFPTFVLNSWKRIMTKWHNQTTLAVYKASQELIDRYGLC